MVIWGSSNSAVYLAREAYQWIMNEQNSLNQTQTKWIQIWKLNLPENVKHLLWLVLHNSLLSNSVHFSRHVTLDPSCNRCGEDQEIIIPILRDCWRAIRI